MSLVERMFGQAQRAARRTWMKYAMRGVSRADNYQRLDLAYQVGDPWVMSSPMEQYRFEQTNRLISDNFGHVGTLLEIGCGEGHQSECLAQLCDQLYGIDVSPTAIERAKLRVPGARFDACDLTRQRFADSFDLIVACEVLYYMQDIRGTLERMTALGRGCFVTYFGPAGRHIDDLVAAIPGARSTTFSFEDTTWNAVWWRSRSLV